MPRVLILKKSKPVGFRVAIQSCDLNPYCDPDRKPGRKPGRNNGRNPGKNLVVTGVPERFRVAKLQSKPCWQP